ncbi:cysteine hydrolase family protein [Liquorilactobacillus mali]|uniref:Isochorismatase-like domain-containing protein n=1 Tax=Liquorilactobacillus mali KCTC 3596 = DSM 20444 TaxID=1046596 RepID=J1F475_9LACO|nr:cysteine hydrolase [Liquorilactobacillus mali]EJF00659.1 isochorismatase family protein [Liquorilactobacillus mali KCTC 3596 = DSM 20444]KRN10163.1 hypothetical protein FD00_GL000398 [Liquorilactobacillus mali KCTC 3596 = DSM 20444]MDC7953035.1 cysteine hydrolase [Liquorilactobacillus mali]QFQ74038.1 cysteine hydrolase [Liquorilactobacillus mali]
MEDTLYYSTNDSGDFVYPIEKDSTILLVVDMQNEFVLDDFGDAVKFKEEATFEQWRPFYERVNQVVIPNNRKLLNFFRKEDMLVSYARIASFRKDGRDRSPVQRRPGWNNILLQKTSYGSQIIDALAPEKEDIIVEKSTDSVVNGTAYVQLLNNLQIKTVVVTGVVTDQCVATSVRDLADRGFNVIVAEDACAGATMDVHEAELKIMNHIYCDVMKTEDIRQLMGNLIK